MTTNTTAAAAAQKGQATCGKHAPGTCNGYGTECSPRHTPDEIMAHRRAGGPAPGGGQWYCVRQARTKVIGSRLMTRAEADREAAEWLAQIGPAAVVPASPDLAHAVRYDDQHVLAPLLPPAVPTAGVTEHDGYTVRAVLQGTQAEGELPNWTVAAEHPDGSWRTWAVVNAHGPLLFCSPTWHEGPGRKASRAAALAEFARRAGIEPGTIRFEAFDKTTGERWAANHWRQEDRPKLTAYVTRTVSRGTSRVQLTFADGTQKTYPKGE